MIRSMPASGLQDGWGYAGKENPDLEDRINARIADMVNLVERKHIPTSDTLQVMDFCKLAS
jgi:hypothetical protein